MSLFSILFPDKAKELLWLKDAKSISESLIEKNVELGKKVEKLNIEKQAFEYFKRVLMDHTNVICKTFTKYGRFALVESEDTGTISNLNVYLEEEDWDGQRSPRPACILSYEMTGNEELFIREFTASRMGKGAGSVAMETLIKTAEDQNLYHIRGNLSNAEKCKDQLLDFYASFGFAVKLYQKVPDIGGEVYKYVDTKGNSTRKITHQKISSV